MAGPIRVALAVGIDWASRVSSLGLEFALPPLWGISVTDGGVDTRRRRGRDGARIRGRDDAHPRIARERDETGLMKAAGPGADRLPTGRGPPSARLAISGRMQSWPEAQNTNPLHHVVDHNTLELPWGRHVSTRLPKLHLGLFDFQITRFMVMELIAAAADRGDLIPLARHVAKNPVTRGRFMNVFETLLLFIRDSVARPAIGGHGADRFLPYSGRSSSSSCSTTCSA